MVLLSDAHTEGTDVDRIDDALRLARQARALLDKELSYRVRVQQQEHDWQIRRLEDAIDNITTVIEDLNGLPPADD